MERKRLAVANLILVSITAVLVVASAVGIYFAYSFSIHKTNTIALQSFSLSPSTSTLSGTINIQTNSQISNMRLYVNGTYLGSLNYNTMRSMMGSMMGGNYAYRYSMMYSVSPELMPMMGNYQFLQNRTYMLTMMATFDDGSVSNASAFLHT
jgi:hypothetical protein